ncbi:MAG: nucleotide sugar dehydrogenase [Candidatus Nitrosocosmicus sp.]
MQKIGIIGAGVVGQSTGKGFHRFGNDVIFYDISSKKRNSLLSEGHKVGSSISDVVSQSDISFVCVDTPTHKDGKQDISQVTSVIRPVLKALETSRKYHLIVIRSTLLPGTMRNRILSYFKTCSSLILGQDYDVCYNPEFLRQNNAFEDFLNPDRVVIGVDHKRIDSTMPLQMLYQHVSRDVIVTGYESAEMIKYVSNCFLSLKISFFNEMAEICGKIGADESVVSLGVRKDRRIGEYGTEAGRPFGGKCLPKDTKAFTEFLKTLNVEPDLLQVALDINEKMSNRHSMYPDEQSALSSSIPFNLAKKEHGISL